MTQGLVQGVPSSRRVDTESDDAIAMPIFRVNPFPIASYAYLTQAVAPSESNSMGEEA